MSPDLLLLCLDAALVACAAILAITAVAGRQRGDAGLVAALSAAVIAHVILGRQDYSAWIAPPFRIDVGWATPWLDILRNATPGLFMVLAHRRFADQPRLPAWLLVLLAIQLGLEGPLRLAGAAAPIGVDLLPTLLQALFAAAAAWWTLADWRDDLVDARRRGRAVVLLVLAVSIVASSVLLRVVIPGDSRANYDAHIALSAFNLALLLALIVRGGGQDLFRDAPARAVPVADARQRFADDAALARLRGLVEDAHAYRQPDLTLARLAAQVALPEYRLRRLIHEHLGFRNFNSFLHAHRIAEVAAALDDPGRRRTPILTLAFDAGYRSVNTFNRGFREIMGVTPSAYRRAADEKSVAQKAA